MALSSLHAGTVTGEFHLVEGHAGHNELAFSVRTAGNIRVLVENATPGVELYAMLVHGATTERNGQGAGSVSYDFAAQAEHVTQAHEWAVRVQAVTPGQQASGRITVSFPDGAANTAHEADGWLMAHPAVALHMRWTGAAGSHTYSAWPREMKERLWRFFDLTRAGTPPSLPDPPRNVFVYGDGDEKSAVHTLITPEDALNLYLAGIAHSLHLEIGRRVPWSLDELNGQELETLVSGASLFWWNADRQGYEIASVSHGWAVPAPPDVAWRFLQDHRMLGRTRLETITSLLGWCKGLAHFTGPVSPDNFEHHWGYRGDMPVSRALAGTRYTGDEFRSLPGSDQVRHYTAGCHGTVGLLMSVLRAANIPVAYRSTGNQSSHATAIFLTEDRALTHGDDPYNQLAVRAGPEEMLIDLATYNAWLGPMVTDTDKSIGRQGLVLGLRHLAPFMLRAYEKDKATGLPREQGEVFGIFKAVYSMQELEASRLWERMDAELSGGGPVEAELVTAPPMKQDTGSAAKADGIAIEAEMLKPTATGGQVQAQPMGGFTSGKWSGDQQLWWTGGKTGDALTLTFAVKAPGVYRLAASFTRAPDYGIVSVTVNGIATKAEKLDLYDTEVTKTRLVPLGEFKLDAGNHRMGITLTGSNVSATPSFMVGVDDVRFERVE